MKVLVNHDADPSILNNDDGKALDYTRRHNKEQQRSSNTTSATILGKCLFKKESSWLEQTIHIFGAVFH